MESTVSLFDRAKLRSVCGSYYINITITYKQYAFGLAETLFEGTKQINNNPSVKKRNIKCNY